VSLSFYCVFIVSDSRLSCMCALRTVHLCTEVTELLIFVQSVLYQKCLFCYRAVFGHSTLKTGLERSHCLGLENDRAISKNQGCGCWCRVWTMECTAVVSLCVLCTVGYVATGRISTKFDFKMNIIFH